MRGRGRMRIRGWDLGCYAGVMSKLVIRGVASWFVCGCGRGDACGNRDGWTTRLIVGGVVLYSSRTCAPNTHVLTRIVHTRPAMLRRTQSPLGGLHPGADGRTA